MTTTRHIATAMVLTGMLMAGAKAAPPDASTSPLVAMAASMTEMGLACGEVSASEANAGKAQQRQAMLAQGMDAKSYDQAYEAAAADFRKKWATLSAAKQKSNCAEMKKAQSAAQGKLK